MAKRWKDNGYDKYCCKLEDIEYSLDYNEVEIDIEHFICVGSKKLFMSRIEYTVKGNGCIKIKASIKPTRFFLEDDLPRFGLMIEMPHSFENVEYYGLGALENLPDFKAQSRLGVFSTTVDAMNEPYIRPQDNGNHGETRWLKITDEDGDGFLFCNSKGNFSFSAHHYTQQLLDEAKHQEDLEDEDTTVVSIDGFVRGAGTASCGQDTLEKYRFSVQEGLKFRFSILPIIKES